MAAILTAMHMRTADDLFGTPQGSPRTDRLIAASIQWQSGSCRKLMTDSEMGSVLNSIEVLQRKFTVIEESQTLILIFSL